MFTVCLFVPVHKTLEIKVSEKTPPKSFLFFFQNAEALKAFNTETLKLSSS